MNKFTITALNDDRLHHPAMWRDLHKNTYRCGLLHSYRTCVQGNSLNPNTFFGPGFTSQMYLKFLTAIYTSERNRSISPTCTLADAAVQVDKRNIITVLLSLLTKHSLNRYESNEKGLLFAIMHFSWHNMDSDQLTVHSCQHRFALDNHFKWQLLHITVPAINRIVHPHSNPLLKFDYRVFLEICAYIASDLFPSWDHISLEQLHASDSSIRNALECLASLMHREPHFHLSVGPKEWVTRSLFLNIVKLCQFAEHHKYLQWQRSGMEFSPCDQDASKLHPCRWGDSSDAHCLIIYILSQGFSRGTKEAYEAFWEKCSWDYIADHAYKHQKAIDGVTSYFTGLLEATKKKGYKNPDVTFPSSYIDVSIKQRLFALFVPPLLAVTHNHVLS